MSCQGYLATFQTTVSLGKNQYSKGQIISKGLFGVLEFSQKRTKQFVVVVKTNSIVRFLGEFEDIKSPFEII